MISTSTGQFISRLDYRMIKDRTPLQLEGNILITGLKQYFARAVFFFYQRCYFTFEPEMTTQSTNIWSQWRNFSEFSPWFGVSSHTVLNQFSQERIKLYPLLGDNLYHISYRSRSNVSTRGFAIANLGKSVFRNYRFYNEFTFNDIRFFWLANV